MRQFFHLKNNFYFLKNVVFALFCFLLGFLFGIGILNAKADTVVKYYYGDQKTNADYDFFNKMKEVEQALKDLGYDYVIVLDYNIQTNLYNSIQDIRVFKTTPSLFKINTSYISVNTKSVYSATVLSQISASNLLTESNLDLIINNLKNYTPNFYLDSTSYLYLSSPTYNYVLYSSSFDVKNTSTITFQFNDILYPPDSILPLASSFRPVYTENLTQPTKDLYRFEYTFDYQDFLNENNMFSHEFNFSTAWSYQQSVWDLYEAPYLQYKKADKYYKLPLDLKKTESLGDLIYADSQINSFKDIQELKFIVPLDNLNGFDDSTIAVHFDSSINFTRKIYNKDQIGEISGPLNNGQGFEPTTSIDDINNTLNDDTPPNAEISGLGNIQGLLPPGPVDSLLNIPVQFLSTVTSSLGGQCTPLSGKWVYDTTLTFPCFDEIIYDNIEDDILLNFLELIPCAFILICYFKHLYKKVDRATSMDSNSDDEWGVI